MKIYYLQNENKEIIEDGFTRFHPDCKEMEREAYHIVNGYNGALFFTDYTRTDEYKEKAAEFTVRSELSELRRRREEECFSVINRGELWYGRLTVPQKVELEQWYDAWLNATETKVVPNKPEWLE